MSPSNMQQANLGLEYRRNSLEHLLVVLQQQEAGVICGAVDGHLRDAWPVAGQDVVSVVLADVDSIVVALLLEVCKES